MFERSLVIAPAQWGTGNKRVNCIVILLSITSQNSRCDISIIFTLIYLYSDINIISLSLLSLSLIKSFLIDNLTQRKESSELSEAVEPDLSFGCHKLQNVGDFCISIDIESFFFL